MEVKIDFDGDQTGTLTGAWNAATLRLVRRGRDITDFTLTYPMLDARPMTFEFDPDKRKLPVDALPHPNDARKHTDSWRAHLGGGVLCDERSLTQFALLPAALRKRFVDEVPRSKIRVIWETCDKLEIRFHDSLNDESVYPDETQLGSALSLALAVCKARGLPVVRRRAKAYSPVEIAQEFAKGVRGAVMDGGAKGSLGVLARVAFEHKGTSARVVFYRSDVATCNVWIETICQGARGAFIAERINRSFNEKEAEDSNRVFLTPMVYVAGDRVANEVARIQMLPSVVQERLFALAEGAELLKLESELLSLRLGDLYDFVERLRAQQVGTPSVLDLAVELGELSRALAKLPSEFAELIEARICSFCHASFVFSPTTQVCTRCGAPAEAADSFESEQKSAPLSDGDDDDLDDIDSIDRSRTDDPTVRERVMVPLRAVAQDIRGLAAEVAVTEEPLRERIWIDYTVEGRRFRAKLHAQNGNVRTELPAVHGAFFLAWDENDEAHQEHEERDDPETLKRSTEDDEWTVADERPVYFSKHCTIQSENTLDEAARIASLATEARNLLLHICETNKQFVSLKEGALVVGLGATHDRASAKRIIEESVKLTPLAEAFSPNYDAPNRKRFELKNCSHCHSAHFSPAGSPSCARCGAPVRK